MNGKDRQNNAHANKARPARVPFSGGNKLHVPDSLKEEGYFYYWAVDTNGIIEQLEAAYYEMVKDSRGNNVTVSAGGGNTHYLMRIEQKYYDEDFARQQKRNLDSTTMQAQTLGEDEYVPMGNKNVVERELI